MSETKAVIQEMAKLSILANKLNDVQIKNLKTFPLIYFDGINQATLEYDISNSIDVSTEENQKDLDVKYEVTGRNDHMHITYKFILEPAVQQTHLEKRFEALEKSVRSILWNDIKVKVFFGDTLMFESKKNE